MTPENLALVAKLFPCPVCGELSRRGVRGTLRDFIKRCPLCALGRPDVWVAGRKWLREREWRFICMDDSYSGDVIQIDYENPKKPHIKADGHPSHIFFETVYGHGLTDLDALLNVIQQVREKEREK